MRIIQIVGTLNFGDAIGNDVIAKKHAIEEMGIDTAIYAGSISPLIKESNAFIIEKAPKISHDDIIIYHMANGSPLNHMVTELSCRKIMLYHNITPYEMMAIDSMPNSENCRRGLEDMLKIKGKFDYHIADSSFNKNDMIKMGYNANKIDVIPIVIPFDDYKKTPDPSMMKMLSDGMTNIVFVGRIAPNKKHEDLIRTFDYYKKNINPNARLILAGSANPNGMYFRDLKEYVEKLGTEDIIFPGHVSFPEILAIYSKADLFLCLSEHEGFCVPLVEAMLFDVPIVAYSACAVPETLGGASVCVEDKDPVFLSKVIDKVVNDSELKNQIIKNQRERLDYFKYENIKAQFQRFIKDFINKFPPITPDSSRKSYDDLYDLVERNMKKSGKNIMFSKTAFAHSAERVAGEVDVSALIDSNYSISELIEAVYISFFNRIPNEADLKHWYNESQQCSRNDFISLLISSAVDSEERKNKGIKVKFNPFTLAKLPEIIEEFQDGFSPTLADGIGGA